MKGSRPSPRSANKKRVAKKTGKAPAVTSQIVARIGRQINDRWPDLGGQFASLLRVSREKIDDLYSSAAEAISEQKEAFDDRRASRKAGERVAIRSVPPAAPARSASRPGIAKGSAVSPSPKRNPSSSKSHS